MSENDPQWIYRKFRELEERVRKLEGPKELEICEMCGQDKNRPWSCFVVMCPKNTAKPHGLVNAST